MTAQTSTTLSRQNPCHGKLQTCLFCSVFLFIKDIFQRLFFFFMLPEKDIMNITSRDFPDVFVVSQQAF